MSQHRGKRHRLPAAPGPCYPETALHARSGAAFTLTIRAASGEIVSLMPLSEDARRQLAAQADPVDWARREGWWIDPVPKERMFNAL
jgi:hypothetical protein